MAKTAPDGITWASLMRGEGWRPGRIFALRLLMGSDDVPMPREEFGALARCSERSIYRWEHGRTTAGIAHCTMLARLAERLTPEQRGTLLQAPIEVPTA